MSAAAAYALSVSCQDFQLFLGDFLLRVIQDDFSVSLRLVLRFLEHRLPSDGHLFFPVPAAAAMKANTSSPDVVSMSALQTRLATGFLVLVFSLDMKVRLCPTVFLK